MAFQRREGVVGGGITKYADKNIHKCPFCGTAEPLWLTDAYIANYSLIASKCVNGYKFKCSKCEGVFEIHANTDFCFQNETFSLVKLVDGGHGTKNLDKVGTPITIQELKKMASEVVDDDPGIVINEESEIIEVNVSKKFDYEDESLNEYLASIKLDEDVIKVVDEPKPKFCGDCGSKLDMDGLCPRCSRGLAPQYTQQQQQYQQSNENSSMTHGILSLVFGIVSLYIGFILFALIEIAQGSKSEGTFGILCLCAGFMLFALIGIAQGRKSEGTRGEKIGKAGRIVSSIGFVISLLTIIFIIFDFLFS